MSETTSTTPAKITGWPKGTRKWSDNGRIRYYPGGGYWFAPGTCEWFAMCDREAVTTIAHPIMGAVPACQRCADRDAAMTSR